MIGVYGANGFIGRGVVNELLARGCSVRAVSRRFATTERALGSGSLDLFEADLKDRFRMLSSLKGVETVIQLISTSSPGLGNLALIEDVQENIIPHITFIQDARDAGVKKFVFISSGGAVYGPDVVVPTPETAKTNPINSHGMTKLVIEKYLQMIARLGELNYSILRVSNPFGPGQMFRKGQGLIPAILERHRSGLPVQVFGDGGSERDYLYISDLVRAICSAALLDGVKNTTLNIGKGESRSIIDVLNVLETALGEPLKREFLPARETDVARSVLDISLARELLSWQPNVSFEEGIRKTISAEV